ncbi:60S ribosomal protein L6 [Phakopsora pachyrhizi]|nr:60S ribosomal protein L6 [Phakopsora pachyrhizi]
MAVTKKISAPRNRAIGPHVNRLTRSQLYSKKALYKRPHKPIAAVKTPEVDLAATKTVKVGGPKNGGQRLVPVKKAPRFYPAEDIPKPKKARKSPRAPGLRSTLTPGTVIIILAGRFRGKRAVFLKQLESGLLLVSGPFKVNGVPLRRVNQAYVIATQTKVESKIDDAYFAKDKKTREQRAKAKAFFAENGQKEKKKCPDSRIADQKAVDRELLTAISQTPNLAKFLASPFGLSKGEFPHLMKF